MSDYKSRPKTFSDELRRTPIDYQRRVQWTLRIAAAWGATILFGAGVFILSRPYMDRRRKEKIASGEFFEEIKENSDIIPSRRIYSKNSLSRDELLPPDYLVGVIDKVLKEENEVKSG